MNLGKLTKESWELKDKRGPSTITIGPKSGCEQAVGKW